MSKNIVLVLTRDQEEFAARLQSLGLPDLEILAPKNDAEILENIEKANILLGNPPMAKSYINKAKNVVWMQSSFAGVDAMNEKDLRKDYVLTNVKDTYGQPMAEYVLAYILMFEKDVLVHMNFQKDKMWKQRPAHVLAGKTVCILGTGSIGREIAKVLKSFGMKVFGYKTQYEKVEFFDEIYTREKLGEFLGAGDYVVSVLPRTVDTDDFFNRETFAMMKSSAVFMNIGRGNAVNEADLVEVMKGKIIAKAVLDVFKEEPLPAQSELWHMPGVYITPHLSGYVINDKIFEIFEENYRRFVKGEALKYQVDFAKGY